MSTRKKICIDIRCLLDEPISGVGMYAYQLLLQYVTTDTSREYVLFFSGRKKSHIITLLEKQLKAYEHISWYWYRMPNKLVNVLWRFGFGPYIDTLTGATMVWLLNFNFYRISPAAHVYCTCHDISFLTIPNVYSLKGRFWHLLVDAKSLYKRATAVIAVSHATAADLYILGIAKKRVHVIYPFFPDYIQTQTISNPTQVGVSTQAGYFLYLGTLDPRKNTLGLLEAYKEYRKRVTNPRPLVLGGRLGWNSRSYYKTISSYINSTPGVTYLGYVPEKDKYDLYAKARAFVFASVYEGFGFPPLEAMQATCPVIASSAGSLPEVVGDAAYMIDPYNQQDLIQALCVLSESDAVCQQYQEKGLQRVQYWRDMKTKSYHALQSILEVD